MLLFPQKLYLHASRDTEALGASLGVLALVVLIILIWLSVKLCNLLFRVFANYPKCLWLWLGLGLVLLSLLTGVLTNWSMLARTFSILSLLILLVIAKFVDLHYSQLLQEQTTTLEKVLRRSWWQPNTNTTLAA